MSSRLLVNPSRRAAIKTGCLGAVIAAGPDKAQAGFGNGDALMIALKHRFFAVADAAERYPAASRLLLERLARRLEAGAGPGSLEQWLARVNSAYAKQNYNHKTTLSAVAVRRYRNKTALVILHGGDSPIIAVNRTRERVEFASSADMNFAGRSARIAQARELELGPDDYTVIIASDGIADLARIARLSLPQFALQRLAGRAPDELPDTAAALLESPAAGHNHDDLAVIAFDPKLIRAGRGRPLILGGTSPAEEAAFRKDLARGAVPDRFAPAGKAAIK